VTDPTLQRTGGLAPAAERRIGVYVCHCGGNISDHVDVDRVIAAVEHEPGVVVARQAMFACSDATQGEIERDIRELQLDGLVVASCSPKLHVTTFRGVARRAGLNPYEYSQVNIREQASWIRAADEGATTDKAIALVKGGIARTALTVPLEPIVVETTQRALVIGGGVAGMRAAIGLADLGLEVLLVERELRLGGHVAGLGPMFPSGKPGRDLVARLEDAIARRAQITVLTAARVVEKFGSFGNYRVGLQLGGPGSEVVTVDVGSIVVATGFESYEPEAGEHGYGIDGVVTLPELKARLDGAPPGPLTAGGRPVRSIAFVYCVGSRETATKPDGRTYCSRYCCTAAAFAAIEVAERDPAVRQFHLARDVRTYGRFELLYEAAREAGSVYLKFAEDEPPEVARTAEGLEVTVRDLLTGGERITIPVDLVVLVTGMVPAQNAELTGILKLPLGRDGFYNEIHPKLRPVETTVDGVYIAGACQGPRTSSESVASALAAVAQSAVILKKGVAELDPLVAIVRPEACDGCAACLDSCPYGAIEIGDRLAAISETACKGCGGCVPLCPTNAIDLRGYTDAQVTALIDGLVGEAVA
jgi:heterodisulfide reductase subunit A